MAVLAPEFLGYTALTNYLLVKRAVKHLKNVDRSYTMEQIYFAIIGGVQIILKDKTHILGETKASKFSHIDVFYEFLKLVKLGVLRPSQLSHKDIKAKNKSNYFVKALICV